MRNSLAGSIAHDDCNRIALKNIDSYLTGRYWRVKTGVGRGIIKVYEQTEDRSVQVTFPASEDIDDYAELVSRGIDIVAKYEGRDPIQLFNDLMFFSEDVFELREVSTDSHNGTISLDRAANMFGGIRASLLSAAMLEIEQKVYYPRQKRNDSDSFISQCRFGQTKRGSYIMTVTCPLAAMPSKPELNETKLFQPNFARRITQRLYLAVDAIAKSAADGNADPILNVEFSYDTISANLCDAVLKMIPASEGTRVELGVRWAKKFPIDNDDIPLKTITLKSEYAPFIQGVSLALKAKSDTGEPDFFFGTLSGLQGKGFKEGLRVGDVNMQLQSESTGERFPAKINLNQEDHQKAIKAYAKEHILVSVHGVLKRMGKTVRIENYSDFKIIGGEV